jgi:hypothetical protein
VCCTGLTGVELFCGSRQVSPTGTCPTGGAHRPDQCRSVRLKFCVPLCSRVCEVGSWQHSSGCVGLANLGSKSETCVGSRVHLVGASISFEKNFYRLTSLPPLSFAVSVLQPYPPDELVQVLYTSRSPRKLIPWNTPGRKLADLLVNV